MKLFFLVLIIASSIFAAEKYSADSASFNIYGQNENTYSAVSDTFPINFIQSNVYSDVSGSFVLTGIDDIPEPAVFFFLLLAAFYLKKFTLSNR